MGKLFNILLLAGGGLWLLSKFGFIAAGSSLVAFLSNARFSGGGLQLELTLQNPAPTGFLVNAIAGRVTVNDNQVGTVSSFEPVSVAPVSETKVWVTVRPDAVGVFSSLMDLLKGGFQLAGAKVGIVGTLNVNGDLVPLNLNLTM